MVLEKCAENIEGSDGFKVLEVELLTRDENPRTKCWRVEVPYSFKDVMEKDEMFPAVWKHRKFFGSRRKKDDKEKRTRRDEDDVLEEVLKQQEAQKNLFNQQKQGSSGGQPTLVIPSAVMNTSLLAQ